MTPTGTAGTIRLHHIREPGKTVLGILLTREHWLVFEFYSKNFQVAASDRSESAESSQIGVPDLY
jgi:hypothetical protein